MPLLSISFYITEKQHDNSVLFYYRKPVWAVGIELAKQKLEKTGFFSKISDDERKK